MQWNLLMEQQFVSDSVNKANSSQMATSGKVNPVTQDSGKGPPLLYIFFPQNISAGSLAEIKWGEPNKIANRK